ncbi:winged helix-turn-helix transcriptional regulator [Nocardia sp. 2YAB30]|uniref:winged helix-turn-helix transcriptional regulator n=1 Tax=Nocardia sp. 2YAB30 TaxID=3233022 RepID=UPI003F9CD074
MRRSSFASMECPIAGALEHVGEWWSLLIMRDALDGFTRFDEFEANLGIAPNMLTRRLRALSDDGLLERVQYSTKPARYEYIVTEKGRDLRPVIIALYLWGIKNTADGARNVVLVDQGTGSEIVPEFVDHHSGRPLSSMRAEFVAGPDASEEMRRRLNPDSRRTRRDRHKAQRSTT